MSLSPQIRWACRGGPMAAALFVAAPVWAENAPEVVVPRPHQVVSPQLPPAAALGAGGFSVKLHLVIARPISPHSHGIAARRSDQALAGLLQVRCLHSLIAFR